MVDRDGVLEHLWESVKERSRTAQIVLPKSKDNHMKDLQEIWVPTKPWTKFKQQYYLLNARIDVERWCQPCDACTTKCNIGAQFWRIATETTGCFLDSQRGN
jgi:hypothetical protein